MELQESLRISQEKEKRKKLINRNMQIIDDQGNVCVYDQRGYLIPAEDYHPPKKSDNRPEDNSNHDNDDNDAKEYREIINRRPDSASIFTKTKKFVEHVRSLRELAKSEIVGEEPWQPAKLPASTIAPTRVKVEVLPQNVIRKWPEYFRLKPLDVILTIEHCWCCHEHNEVTHHDESKYRNVAKSVHDAMILVAQQYNIRYFSLIKPIEFDDQLELSKNRRPKSADNNGEIRLTPQFRKTFVSVDYSNRIGAMEIQLAVKLQNQLVCHLLHSKLFSGLWPKLWTLQNLFEEVLELLGFDKVTIMPTPSWAPKEPMHTPTRKRSAKKSQSNDAAWPLEQLFDYRNGRESNYEASTTSETGQDIIGRVLFEDAIPTNDAVESVTNLSLLDVRDVVDDAPSAIADVVVNPRNNSNNPSAVDRTLPYKTKFQDERKDNKESTEGSVIPTITKMDGGIDGTSDRAQILLPQSNIINNLPIRSATSTDVLLKGNSDLRQDAPTSYLLRTQSDVPQYTVKLDSSSSDKRVGIRPAIEPVDYQPKSLNSTLQSESKKRIDSDGDLKSGQLKKNILVNDISDNLQLDVNKLTTASNNPVSRSGVQRTTEKKVDTSPYSDLIRQFEEDLASFNIPPKPVTSSTAKPSASPVVPIAATVTSNINTPVVDVSKDIPYSKPANKDVENLPTADKAPNNIIRKDVSSGNSSLSNSDVFLRPVIPVISPVPKLNDLQSTSSLEQKTVDVVLSPTPRRVSVEASHQGNRSASLPAIKAKDLYSTAVETVNILNSITSSKRVTFEESSSFRSSRDSAISTPSISSPSPALNNEVIQLSSAVTAHPFTVSSAANSANAIIPFDSKPGGADISSPLVSVSLINESAPNSLELPIPILKNTKELRFFSIAQDATGSPCVTSETVSISAATAVSTPTPIPSISFNDISISDPVSIASVPQPETMISSLSPPESKNIETKKDSEVSYSTPTIQTQTSKHHRYLSAKDADKIIKSYGSMCAYCEIAGTAADFELDFIIPLNDGGDTTFTNFQPLCADCFAIANPGSDSNSPSNDLGAQSVTVVDQPSEAISTMAFQEDVPPLINAAFSDIILATSDQGEQNYHTDSMLLSITPAPIVAQAPAVLVVGNLDIAPPVTAPLIDDRGEVDMELATPMVQSTSYSPSVSIHSSVVDMPIAAQSNEFIQMKEMDAFPTSSSIPDRGGALHVANDNGKREDSIVLPKVEDEGEYIDIDDEDDDLDLYNDTDFKLEIPVLFPNENIRSNNPSPSVLGDSSAILTPQNSAAKLKDILKMNASKLNLLQNNLNKLLAEDDDDSSNDSDKYSKKEKRSEEDFWKDLVKRIDDDD